MTEGFVESHIKREREHPELTPVWPSTVTRNVEGETTNICLFTGKEWVGRYEEDVCTIIKQITGDVQ